MYCAMSEQMFVYPDEEQAERWKARCEELEVSKSEFIQNMVEAGLKSFDASVDPDESLMELREQRNRLRKDLRNAHNRVESLENRLDRGERAAIIEFVQDNPGVEYEDIMQHLANSIGSRLSDNLDMMEGETLTAEDGSYYYFEGGKNGE